jgi:SIR2-like domain
MPQNPGNFSKFTLLTGAGWSRNWGGRLASEVWQTLMDDPAVQANARLRALLLAENSFETALAMTRAEPFDAADRQQFENALLEAFISMDREMARADHDPWINIYGVQRLLFRFAGQRSEGVDTGYLFTLNQDLFPERYLFNEHVSAAPPPALPGIQPRPGQRLFTANIGPYSEAFEMSPLGDLGQARLQGQTNVIKLHGSYNWRSADGRNVLVVGTQKSEQIAELPLLAWYGEVFRGVLAAGDMRLMIVGYGFADEHINAMIADAIAKHRLRVFIWDVVPNLKERVLAAPHGAVIWGGLLSTASRQMVEVFPSNQADTEECRRIYRSFFG